MAGGNGWTIRYLDCVEPGDGWGAMARFEVTSPQGTTITVRPLFSGEFIDKFFNLSRKDVLWNKRSEAIKDNIELFKSWALLKIEGLLDEGILEHEPQILSQEFDWARKVKTGELRPSSLPAGQDLYLFLPVR